MFISRLFLVPKPGKNHWRLIYDLRHIIDYCTRKHINMVTLLCVRHLLTRHGDYMFGFDMHDGFYAPGIAPEYRDYFTVNVCG
jgi:hypothetical protein